ncbi:hypothetical protein [Caldalkalibacillus mannanilyticus]|uniref:hypothetical protein n=1 Tax=Caldalkalibacillus mannanilyticus TaxID=1418 RepID=UPI00046A1C16|nr:hypothetical protein [Caldalkalibacillus mannanilyticus]
MRMAWWTSIFYLSIVVILVQYMVESYLAGHYELLPYYSIGLAFMLLVAGITHYYFRQLEETRE